MRRPASALIACLALAASVFGLGGCQQLFTTSLAKGLARATLPIPTNLTADQANALAAEAKANGDTKLAAALVTSLVTEIAATTDPTTKAALESTAAGAAVTASGLGSTLATLVANAENGGTLDTASILAEVQAGTTPAVLTALEYMNPSTGGLAASGLSATDYVIAAAAVAASVIPAGCPDPAAYVTSNPTNPAIVSATAILTAGASLAATDPNSKSLYDQIAGAFGLPSA